MSVKTESQVLNIPIEDIIPNRFQPRLNFDDSALNELASSIKEHGIIQPLVVRRIGEKFEIIAGERRYKAAKLAGLTSVPAVVTEMSDEKSAQAAIVENVQRRDLSAIEEAKSYENLLEKGYLTQEKLAKKMGLSQSAISNKLRLLSLSDEVQKALMENKISERHARSLLQLKDPAEQNEWLKKILEERMTVKELNTRLKSNMNNTINTTINTETNIVPPVNNEVVNNVKKDIFSDLHIEEKPIPNKFFNFLEDEQANMGTSDNNSNAVPFNLPANEIVDNTAKTDDVEMLDFVPENVSNAKDMTIANSLIDKLKLDLNNNNYEINVLTDESDTEIKYIITVKK